MGVPASAATTESGYELEQFTSSSYFSATAGSGFSFANNTSISVGFDLQAMPTSTQTITQFALSATNGWQVQINSSGVVILTTPGGGSSINIGTASIGINVIVATRDLATTDTLRTALNNLQPQAWTLPNYVATTSSSVALIGNDDAHATAFAAGAVLWVQGYSAVLSDSDIAKKAANGTLNSGETGFHNIWLPDTTASESSLVFDWEIGAGRDWSGVASTSTSEGSSPVTFTVVGSPARAALSAQVITETAAHPYIQDNVVTTAPYSVHARYVFSTTSTRLCVTGTTSYFFATSGQYLGGGIYTVSGTTPTPQGYYYGAWAAGVPGTSCLQLSGSGTQTVEVWNGPQVLEGSTIAATTVNVVWFTGGALQAVSTVAPPTNRMVIVGDSISAVGFYGSPMYENSNEALYRNATRSDLGVAFWGWGNASLHSLCTVTYANCAAFGAAIASTMSGSSGDHVVVMALQTNDYLLPTESASSWQTEEAAVVNAIHTNDAAAKVYVRGMTLLGGTYETTTNSFGSLPDDFRTAGANVVSGIGASWAVSLNYKNVVASGDLYSDHIHLVNTGHSKVEAQELIDLGF